MSISFEKVFSERNASEAIYTEEIPAGLGCMRPLKKGQFLRIEDVYGNQGLDFLCYDLHNPEDHYSSTQTIVRQKNIYLNTGTVMVTESGKELLKIVADTCTCQDTLGGACACESNTVRYGHHTLHMRTCRDTFLELVSQRSDQYGKAEIVPNMNIFAQIVKMPDDSFEFCDGISAPGSYIEFEALSDTMILISNCPQINNPCSGFNPTPNRIYIFDK